MYDAVIFWDRLSELRIDSERHKPGARPGCPIAGDASSGLVHLPVDSFAGPIADLVSFTRRTEPVQSEGDSNTSMDYAGVGALFGLDLEVDFCFVIIDL